MMQLLRVVRSNFCVIPVVALLGFLGWLDAPLVPVAVPQGVTGLKAVDIETQIRVDPVTIESVIVNGQQIQPGTNAGPREVRPGTAFRAENDWLGGMTLLLRKRRRILQSFC